MAFLLLYLVSIVFCKSNFLTLSSSFGGNSLCYQGASLIAQLVENPAMQETPVRFQGQEDPLEKGKATHCSILGFPCGSADKESACNVGDLGSIPGLGGSPGEGKGYPLQYSGLENSMEVHGVTESEMTERLSLPFTSMLSKILPTKSQSRFFLVVKVVMQTKINCPHFLYVFLNSLCFRPVFIYLHSTFFKF